MFKALRFGLLAIAATALLGLTACSKSPAEKIVGSWSVDVDALAQTEEFKNMPEDKRKMALEMAKGMMSQMTFEITKDKIKTSMMGKTMEATYTVKSTDGDKITLLTKEIKDGKEGKEEEVTMVASSGSNRPQLNISNQLRGRAHRSRPSAAWPQPRTRPPHRTTQ